MIKKSKVVLLSCAEYDEEKIYALLKKGLSLVDGIESLIPMDKKILLKPNLLKKAEEKTKLLTMRSLIIVFIGICQDPQGKGIQKYCTCGLLWPWNHKISDPWNRNGYLSGKISDSGH